MNWNDPVARAALLETVGAAEYNRRFEQHREQSVRGIVNGYKIYEVQTPFGLLLLVGGTDKAFAELAQATAHANGLPAGPHKPN